MNINIDFVIMCGCFKKCAVSNNRSRSLHNEFNGCDSHLLLLLLWLWFLLLMYLLLPNVLARLEFGFVYSKPKNGVKWEGQNKAAQPSHTYNSLIRPLFSQFAVSHILCVVCARSQLNCTRQNDLLHLIRIFISIKSSAEVKRYFKLRVCRYLFSFSSMKHLIWIKWNARNFWEFRCFFLSFHSFR